MPRSRSLVHFCRQLLDVPLPLLKRVLVGSQAMSPAVAMAGSLPTWASVGQGDGRDSGALSVVVVGGGGGGTWRAPR